MDFIGQSGKRIRDMRDRILSVPSSVCIERARIFTEACKANEDEPVIMRRALANSEVLKKMTIRIEDGELIVGNQSSRLRAAPVFPEYDVNFILEEIDEFDKRPGDVFHVRKEDREELLRICAWWKGRTLKDKGLAYMPKDSRVLYDIGVIRAEGCYTSGDGHIAVDFETVLEQGLSGIERRVRQSLAGIDVTKSTDIKKKMFLDAVLILLASIGTFALRYAERAREMASGEKGAQRRKELLEIARICERVPMNPAAGFREAIQSAWFIQLLLQIESNGHSVSYGRLDQYLYTHYAADLASGAITEEDACELLENLWIKTYSINKIRSWAQTRTTAGNPLYQNVTIGGQTPDGHDAVNPLSSLVLKSFGRTRLTQPNLTVRYHRNISDDFMMKCIEIIKLGTGMPAFNNDEVIIPSFIRRGVRPEDARDYSAIGCVEVAVPGRWGYRCTGMSFFNLSKALMIVMNGGVDPVTGTTIFASGFRHFRDMKSFEELYEAWARAVPLFVRQTVIVDTCVDIALEQEVPDVLCSALTHDCIERGLTIKEGGAIYDFVSGVQVGVANLGNSLEAIKKIVFDEKLVSPGELWRAIETNFEAEGGEAMRQVLLKRAPKYGNDSDDVDTLTADAYTLFIDEIEKYKNTRFGRGPIGGAYYAGTSSVSANVPMGMVVGATPDGRKAFEPVAEGCSPYRGTDTSGPTAVLKSVGKLPTDRITGGVLLNQKLSPNVLRTESDMKKLLSMMRTFFNVLRGFHVQYNVVDRQTLLDAQRHPESYRDLIVRVAGYSAFFNVLSPDTQMDIINRTEHVL
jgi:pyruvate formate-lyase/glycerol dehydratase family glycyl radical enzyme